MIYLAGSLKTLKVREVAQALRDAGFEVFDDWHAAGRIADREWQEHYEKRGFSYSQALQADFPQWNFLFDINHIAECDAFVTLSVGRSSCWELGYAFGLKIPTFLLLENDPKEWDQMLAGTTIIYSVVDLIYNLQELSKCRA